MKLFLLLVSLTSATFALDCGKKETVLNCKAADQPEDSEFALRFMTDAVICKAKNGKLTMKLDGPDWKEAEGQEVPVSAPANGPVGATAYSTGKVGDMKFTLTRKMVSPTEKSNATFRVDFLSAGYYGSRSLKCK